MQFQSAVFDALGCFVLYTLIWAFTLVGPVWWVGCLIVGGFVLRDLYYCEFLIQSGVLLIKLNFAYMYFSTRLLSEYGNWSSRVCGWLV